MREILFKAKRQNWEELPKDKWWVIGYLVKAQHGRYTDFGYEEYEEFTIVTKLSCGGIEFVAIDENTICQYTGLTDKNGNKIWENDVVNIHIFHEIAEGHGTHVNEKGVICYDKIGILSVAVDITDGIPCYSDILFQAEIAGIGFDIEAIGNTFDNACIDELLKGEE